MDPLVSLNLSLWSSIPYIKSTNSSSNYNPLSDILLSSPCLVRVELRATCIPTCYYLLILMMLSSFCLFLTFIAATRTQFTTVAIVATNDIHGSAFPTQMERSDTGERYSYGGLAYMGGIIDIIKAEYPDHTIFLDAGDQFQGGIESSKLISSGKIMNDFYAALDLNASAIGNHEFDFGP